MKKKILGNLLIGLLVICLTGCFKEKSVILKDDIKLEVNEEVNIGYLISDNNELEVINKDELIDTTKVGEKEITIKYKYNDKEKEQKSIIKIVDTQKPIIKANKNKVELFVNDKVDLKKQIKAVDNYDGDITDKVMVTGSVDTSKIGNYEIKYNVVDSSSNKSDEVSITYVVKEVFKLVLNKRYEYETKDSIGAIKFSKNKVVEYICAKQGGCITSEGKYSVKGNTVKVTYTLVYHLAKGIDDEKINSKVNYTLGKNSIKDSKNVYKLSK